MSFARFGNLQLAFAPCCFLFEDVKLKHIQELPKPMPNTEIMLVVTLAMSTLSLVMASVALLPQLKEGIAIVRDAVLWGALVALLIVVAAVGWLRLANKRGVQPDQPNGESRQQASTQLY
jgi:hypothetical protein